MIRVLFILVFIGISPSFSQEKSHKFKVGGFAQVKLLALDFPSKFNQLFMGTELQVGGLINFAEKHSVGLSLSSWYMALNIKDIGNENQSSAYTRFWTHSLAVNYRYSFSERTSLQLGVTVPILSYHDNNVVTRYDDFFNENNTLPETYLLRKKINAIIPLQVNYSFKNGIYLNTGVQLLVSEYYIFHFPYDNQDLAAKDETDFMFRTQLFVGVGFNLLRK